MASLLACKPSNEKTTLTPPRSPEEEIFYLIFPRSFYDSNGDRIGDLRGVIEKLDYIQSLGVTSIIMTPLSPSVYYHNYFVNDFEGIDPEFGTLQDYLDMIAAIHKRGMKFYMDTEWQYATKNQLWFRESYGHPESKYTKYLFYHDSLNLDPESIMYNLKTIPAYDGKGVETTLVNLKNEEVKKYMENLYAFWMDPNHDGKFDDGVDGFRIDHMMDDLDHKGLLTNLFEEYWHPLITKLKSINPKLLVIAEQADWQDPGLSYFTKAGVDIVYGFGYTFHIGDNQKFGNLTDTLLKIMPPDKYLLTFLDNHDLDRYASMVRSDPNVMRRAATMLYLSKGIPYIYYGQELGMKGAAIIHGKDDGNDILRREAMEWNADMDQKGMALWYKDSGPWWDSTFLRTNDGISVEEEDKDSTSLLNFYRNLLIMRRSNPGLAVGEEAVLKNNNASVFSYCRWKGDSKFLLAFNFTMDSTGLRVLPNSLPFKASGQGNEVMSSGRGSHLEESGDALDITLGPKGYIVLKMK